MTQSAVLVVEEETDLQRALVEHLNASGFAAEGVATSDEALRIVEQRADLKALVTDAHLPGGIEGYTLASLAQERRPDLALILTSGHSDPTSGPVPDGAVFIAKPYLSEHLSATLKRILGER